MFQIRKADRKKSRIRLLLGGASGSGKTYSALLLAKGLTGGDMSKVLVIDTEGASAEFYSAGELAGFHILELSAPFHPDRYVQALRAGEQAGYAVIILDSITHEWNGAGGCLDIHQTFARKKDSYAAWNDVTPLHRRFLDAITQSPAHVLATVRKKTDYERSQDEKTGHAKIQKVGLKEEQREGLDYEFMIVFDIYEDHKATVNKDRTGLFADRLAEPLTVQTGQQIRAFCDIANKPTAPQPTTTTHEATQDTQAAGMPESIQAINTLEQLRAAFDKLTKQEQDEQREAFGQRKIQIENNNNNNAAH